MHPIFEEVGCSCEVAFNFICLSVIRGTTPLMLFFAVRYLNSSCLVIVLKCGITLSLLAINAIWLLSKAEVRFLVLQNLSFLSTYWKLFVIGVLQSAFPYLLTAYSVQYVPVTLIGAFMVMTPWWIYFIEYSLLRDINRIPKLVKVGMIIGLFAAIAMIVPILVQTVSCEDKHNVNNTTLIPTGKPSGITNETLKCKSFENVLTGIIALSFAPISWAAASLFWKKRKGEIHFIVSNIGQNLIGGIISIIVWLIFGTTSNFPLVRSWIVFVIYLGAATGWLGTLLLLNLYSNLGSATINQALTGIPFIAFIEDYLFIEHSVIKTYRLIVEVLAVICITAAVFISNIPDSKTPIRSGRDSMSEALLTEYSEGMQSGVNQVLQNQIQQYNESHSINNTEEDDADEEINSQSKTDQELKYPLLTEVK